MATVGLLSLHNRACQLFLSIPSHLSVVYLCACLSSIRLPIHLLSSYLTASVSLENTDAGEERDTCEYEIQFRREHPKDADHTL